MNEAGDQGRRRRTVEVLIVGAGPSGLTAAATLAAAGAGRVEVLERDPAPGGVPRHCAHGGFGAPSLPWRPLDGPEYARHLTDAAVRAGATIRTGVTATGWAPEDTGPADGTRQSGPGPAGRAEPYGSPTANGRRRPGPADSADSADQVVPWRDPAGRGHPADQAVPGQDPTDPGHPADPSGPADPPAAWGASNRPWALEEPAPASSLTLDVTGPGGLERITASAVLLATGARERSRSARLVPGARAAGVLTAGELQQSVHLYGVRGDALGRRAVVVGAGPVGPHAARTLRGAGLEVVALVTDGPRPSAYRRSLATDRVPMPPLLAWTTVTGVVGRGRITGVTVRHRGGRTGTLPCDTVVFTDDWVPHHELARSGGVALDPGTRGPEADGAFRTSVPGVFAAGNALRGIESAAVAAGEGRDAAFAVMRHLAGAPWPSRSVPLVVEPPLLWVSPNRIDAPFARRPFLVRPAEPLRLPVLVAVQDGRLLLRTRRLRALDLSRSVRIAPDWAHAVDPDGGPVVLRAR